MLVTMIMSMFWHENASESGKAQARHAVNLPWNKKSPTMFEAKPKDPTKTTRRGLEISVYG